MPSLDDALEKFREIYDEFKMFSDKKGEASESDTRHKIIDRLLKDVLGWKHYNITCEEKTEDGFCDYVLYSKSHTFCVIEAKKSGISWTIPSSPYQKRQYKLSGVISRNKEIDKAIRQVQLYCNDKASKYAVATNGFSFIIFKAISETTPWRDGKAIVFHSPQDIESNFSTFYELLSYECSTHGIINKHFSKQYSTERVYDRPLLRLSSPNADYGRNIISSLIDHYIAEYFGDIASQVSNKILEDCYVHSSKLRLIDRELKVSIEDEIPHFAESDGFRQLNFDDERGDLAHDLYHYNTLVNKGGFAILMGGIGCGKSTYLKRFLRIHSDDFSNRTKFYYINFIGFAEQALQVFDFSCKTISEYIKADENIIDRKTLEIMYKDEIDILKQTVLYGLSEDAIVEKTGTFLHNELTDNKKFTEKALITLNCFSVLPILIFDNVDQLPIETQIDILKTAQYISKQTGCFCILSMREESYCTYMIQKILTAYVYRKYHISSPSLKQLLQLRFQSVLERLKYEPAQTTNIKGIQISTNDIILFFEIVQNNILQRYRPIIKLIESLSFGDMRLALEILTNFMCSGATDVAKILSIQKSSGEYKIPFHEFVKSVALKERKYYKENSSLLVNIFSVSESLEPSHFCGLRLLKYLHSKRSVSSSDGIGFVSIYETLNIFEEFFGDRDDVLNTIMKYIMLNKHLIELNTRRTDSIDEASSLRITPAGIYYLSALVNRFVYLDLTWQDTPLNDSELSQKLVYMIHSKDFNDRISRVNSFISYLKNEEKIEENKYNITQLPAPFNTFFTPLIENGLSKDLSYIKKRLDKFHAT